MPVHPTIQGQERRRHSRGGDEDGKAAASPGKDGTPAAGAGVRGAGLQRARDPGL